MKNFVINFVSLPTYVKDTLLLLRLSFLFTSVYFYHIHYSYKLAGPINKANYNFTDSPHMYVHGWLCRIPLFIFAFIRRFYPLIHCNVLITYYSKM